MRLLTLLLMLAFLAALASSAQAATVAIPGDPMIVYVSDVGRVTGRLEGDTSNVFFSPSNNDSPSAGFNLGFPVGFGASTTPVNYGVTGSSFTAVSQGALTGAGTPASPYRVTTLYRVPNGAGTAAEVTQVVTYLNGNSRFTVSYAVKNLSGAPLRFRAGEFADLYLAGSDSGTGFFEAGSPRLVGGFNAASGRVGGIEEVAGSPWDRYEEDQYSTVRSNLGDLLTTGLDNTINPASVDNGVAVQWDDFFTTGLASNGTASFATTWSFAVGRLLLSPGFAGRAPGALHTVTVAARNPNGAAVANTPVRYTISGANPSGGAVTTDGTGRATITWRGNAAGVDTLGAYTDLNSSGVRDASEPGATATVLWVVPPVNYPIPVDSSIDAQLARLPAPTLAKAVNVAPVTGDVFVKLAAGAAARAAQSKGRGFIPLRQARQIPVGSLLDTTGGTVRLVSAANSSGKRQQGDFNGGFFAAIQSRSGRGLTELRLKGGKFSGCTKRTKRGKRASAARRRYKKRTVRRLRGDATGRFSTRGKYSSATVRGTQWTVTDRCDGTLTRVKRGVVVVRDLRRRKNLVVRAGKSRLVRAPG